MSREYISSVLSSFPFDDNINNLILEYSDDSKISKSQKQDLLYFHAHKQFQNAWKKTDSLNQERINARETLYNVPWFEIDFDLIEQEEQEIVSSFNILDILGQQSSEDLTAMYYGLLHCGCCNRHGPNDEDVFVPEDLLILGQRYKHQLYYSEYDNSEYGYGNGSCTCSCRHNRREIIRSLLR